MTTGPTILDLASITVTSRFRRDMGDIDALAASIRELGLLHPIVVDTDRTLVAGQRRLEACRRLGLDAIAATVVDLDDTRSLIAERDENETAKPFTVSERVAIGRAIEERLGERRGSNQYQARSEHPHNSAEAPPTGTETRDIAAERAGFGSHFTYRQAKAIVESGSPELVEAVDEGEVSVSAAAEIARQPHDEQREIVARGRDEIVKIANRIRREQKEQKRAERETRAIAIQATLPAASDRWRLINSAAADLDEIGAGSVNCIITDPPYPREFLSVYADLAETAARVLEPGGSCFVMIGQSYMPQIIEALSSRLTYQWTLAYLTPGGQAVQVFPRKVNTFWKPVLWFVNGAYGGQWLGDVAQSRPNDNDKRFHHWGQSESGMADLVRRCSEPGDLILDPFCGAGTTGVVAVSLGRRFIGSDLDAGSIATASARLSEECRDAA